MFDRAPMIVLEVAIVNSNINEHSNNDAILVILTRAIFSTREHSPCILPSIVSRQTRAVFMARFAVSARSEP